MREIREDEVTKRLSRHALLLDGYTEEEVDELERAIREDRNISRFTDPEIILVKKVSDKTAKELAAELKEEV